MNWFGPLASSDFACDEIEERLYAVVLVIEPSRKVVFHEGAMGKFEYSADPLLQHPGAADEMSHEAICRGTRSVFHVPIVDPSEKVQCCLLEPFRSGIAFGLPINMIKSMGNLGGKCKLE